MENFHAGTSDFLMHIQWLANSEDCGEGDTCLVCGKAWRNLKDSR